MDGVNARFGDARSLNSLKKWVATWTTRCAIAEGFPGTDFSAGSGGRAVSGWHAPDDYWRRSLEELHVSLRGFDYCVTCGATAWILMKVFEAFGFDAWTLDLGKPPDSRITHVVTLVRVGRNLEVFDSDTGLVMRLGGGSEEIALSLEAHIKNPPDFGEASYFVEKTIMINVDSFSDLPNYHYLLPELVERRETDFKRIRNGMGVFRGIRINPDNLMANPLWPDAGKWLQSQGLPAHPLSIFLFPQGISSLWHGWVDERTSGDNESTDLFARLVEASSQARANLTS